MAKKLAVYNNRVSASAKPYGRGILQAAFSDDNCMFKLTKVSTGEVQKEHMFSSTSTGYMTAEQRLVDKTCIYNMANADYLQVLHFMIALPSICTMVLGFFSSTETSQKILPLAYPALWLGVLGGSLTTRLYSPLNVTIT